MKQKPTRGTRGVARMLKAPLAIVAASFARGDDPNAPVPRGPVIEEEFTPERPKNPEDVDAPLPLQVSRVNPPDWAIEFPVGDIHFLSDGRLLVSRKDAPKLAVVDPSSGEIVRTIDLAGGLIERLKVSADDRWLSAQRPLAGIQIFELATFEVVGSIAPTDRFGFAKHAISPDGKYVASGSKLDAGVLIWEVATGKQIARALHETDSVDALEFSPDGRWLVMSVRNKLTYWKWQMGEAPAARKARRRIVSLAFTSDSRYIMEGPDSRLDIEVRELETMRLVRRIKDETGHGMILDSMEVIDGGRTLVAGNSILYDWRKVIVNERLHFWDIETGAIKRKFEFTRHQPRNATVSPDGAWLAASLSDLNESLLAVWNLKKAAREQSP